MEETRVLCADDINELDKFVKKNTETWLQACKEVDVERRKNWACRLIMYVSSRKQERNIIYL
jgi:hypothetical protein